MKYSVDGYFAQAYGTCPYGSGTDQTGSCGSQAATPAANSKGGLLTNTGFDIALIVTLACTIIFVALVVRFWKRPKKQQPNL